MSSALVAAYKFDLQTSGGSTEALNHPPSFYAASQNPPTVIVASVAYSAGEVDDIKIVGLPEVGGVFSITAGTTRRANVMFVYDSTQSAAILGAIRTYVDYTHFVDGAAAPTPHQYRFYIYNENTAGWSQIDTDDTTGGVRTMQGQVIANLPDYIDGSGNINVLMWDFEGTRNQGAGCVIEGTLIHTPQGKRQIETLQCKDVVWCMVDGVTVERQIADITKHYATDFQLVELIAGTNAVTITEDHPFPTSKGIGRGKTIKNGDLMVGLNGFERVNLVRTHTRKISVYDFSPHAQNYFVGPGDGLLINRSDSL